MKRMVVLLIAAALLLACVPTPEQDAVKQKDTNVLIDTVLSEQTQTEADNPPAPVSAQLPARFQCDETTEARGVHIVADVPIEILTDGTSFPVLRVEHRHLTNEERLSVCRRLFGADTLYIWKMAPRTRDDVKRNMESCLHSIEYLTEHKAEWMRESESTEQEWHQLLDSQQQRLAELKQEFNSLPEDVKAEPNKPWDGFVPEDNPSPVDWNAITIVADPDLHDIAMQYYDQVGIVEQSKDRVLSYSHARSEQDVIGTADGFHGETADATRILPSAYDTPPADGAITAREAIGIVKEILGTEAENYAVADVWWSNNAYSEGEIQGVYDKWGYLIRLTPAFSGAQLVFLYHDAYESDDYFRRWPYDRIEAHVASDGTLLALSWDGALKVTETVSETSPLLSYDEVKTLFVNQMNRKFSMDEYAGGTVSLSCVKLGLMRIREKNDMEHGLLVPAWFFYGTFEYAEQERDARIKQGFFPEEAARKTYNSEHPLLIINAIDGSVIDRYLGY